MFVIFCNRSTPQTNREVVLNAALKLRLKTCAEYGLCKVYVSAMF